MARSKKEENKIKSSQTKIDIEPKKIKAFTKIQWTIFLIILLASLIISIFKIGIVGVFVNNIFSFLFSRYYIVSLALLIFISIYKLKLLFKNQKLPFRYLLSTILLIISFQLLIAILHTKDINSFKAFATYFFDLFKNLFQENFDFKAGVIGQLLYVISFLLLQNTGTIILIITLIMIALVLILPFGKIKSYFITLKENISHDLHEEENNDIKDIEFKQLEIEKNVEQQEQAQEKPISLDEKYPGVLSKDSNYFINLENELINSSSTSLSQKSKDLIINEKVDLIEDNMIVKPVEDFNTIKYEPKDDNKNIHTIDYDLVKLKNKKYIYPPISVFEQTNIKTSNINKTSANVKGQKVIEILKQFEIDAELINTYVGPTVTKFEIKPDSRIKVSKILSIQDNIKMELAAKDIRIEAPIPGRNAVGIEIPNVECETVKMCDVIKAFPPRTETKPIFMLGKDLFGKPVTCDLTKMPHLLIAGATGSGKSVCINTIISSFLYNYHPDDLKLVLVDPKKVEFSPYHDVPHLYWPVITDSKIAGAMLNKMVLVMEERYELFSSVGVRNIVAYNSLVDENNKTTKDKMKHMSYIVIIIDELADLMQVAKNEVEGSIQRITQLARACGMHLIVATQRPSTDVITGVIKSNIPSRIAFAVASSIDSRTILDATGADRLLGNGDMLYSQQGSASPIRIQGVFLNDNEVKNICDHCKNQASPSYDDFYFEFTTIQNDYSLPSSLKEENDELFNQAYDYIVSSQKASTSLLQRRFQIGYNRAARLIDTFEAKGYIGPANGSKPREVYIKKEDE